MRTEFSKCLQERSKRVKKNNSIKNITMAAVFLALCMVLPLITGNIPAIGNMLSPMHIPVLLAGFVCGPGWAMLVGLIAPILRSMIFGMPPLFPTACAMAFELATYGFVSGFLYTKLKKTTANIYVALIGAMLVGRAVWGVAMMILMGISGGEFTLAAFIAGAFTKGIPGIIVHIVLIPALVMALRRAKLLYEE